MVRVGAMSPGIFPDLPLIGYERDEALADAQNSGFKAVGSLRVWLAEA